MIPFEPRPEPAHFAVRVRKPGRRWLKQHPGFRGRPPPFWREVRHEVAEAFRHLCAYSATFVQEGTVDHFRPIQGRYGKPALAYEWTNYRYASHTLNSRKSACDPDDLLDPFEVKDGWFEIILPSCQLILTPACPPMYRRRARTMLEKLGLGHHETTIRYRRQWLDRYEEGLLTLEGLAEFAPLLARAVQKKLARENHTSTRLTLGGAPSPRASPRAPGATRPRVPR